MKKLYVEIADNPIKREYGLMDRKKMAKNCGMFFKFSSPRYLSFWMKSTYIPLDVAFINNEGKILEIRELVPLSTRAITSREFCRYALEVNKGWFKENRIKEGSYIFGKNIKEDGLGKKAQIAVEEVPLEMPGEMPMEPEVVQEPSPDVMLNRSFKDVLRDADLNGTDLIIIYETKYGRILPPKVISPPFTFESDADGIHDAIVKVWDNQTAGWKSFLVNNIIEMEEKE